jgi:hypothetical protein
VFVGSGIPISCTIALPHSQILAHSFCALVFLPAAFQISALMYSYTTASLHSFSYLLLHSRSPVICIPELLYTCIAAFWNSCIFGLMISCFVASLHFYTYATPHTCNPQRCGTLVYLHSFTFLCICLESRTLVHAPLMLSWAPPTLLHSLIPALFQFCTLAPLGSSHTLALLNSCTLLIQLLLPWAPPTLLHSLISAL